MEFVLGSFSCFCIEIAYSNFNFCGTWTSSFFEFTWKMSTFQENEHTPAKSKCFPNYSQGVIGQKSLDFQKKLEYFALSGYKVWCQLINMHEILSHQHWMSKLHTGMPLDQSKGCPWLQGHMLLATSQKQITGQCVPQPFINKAHILKGKSPCSTHACLISSSSNYKTSVALSNLTDG